MRILLWHGYLLGGTGSNVYTRALAREWSRAGHDVTVLSQEPRPDDFELGGAATVRPEVGGYLPVFVLDRYEGYTVERVSDADRARLEMWVEANAAAVRELLPADLVFTNHVLLGAPGPVDPLLRCMSQELALLCRWLFGKTYTFADMPFLVRTTPTARTSTSASGRTPITAARRGRQSST